MTLHQRDTLHHTYADYLTWPDGESGELINGVAYIGEPPVAPRAPARHASCEPSLRQSLDARGRVPKCCIQATAALEGDRIFLQFITGEHDAFVIEDADHILTSRASGNEDVHRFLAIADGVVRAQGRKILFTTNLPNVHDIDDALLRPGRCFGSVRTRALNRAEAARLLQRLCKEKGEPEGVQPSKALPDGVSSMTLAEIYRHFPTEG